MVSYYIDQEEEGLFLAVGEDQAAAVRQALFQASLSFREDPPREGRVRFHLGSDVASSTVYRALEALA